MDKDIKLALLGDREAAKRLTEVGKLLPCPWCGATETATSETIWPQIMCEKCGAKSPRGCDVSEARLYWNTRAPILSESELKKLCEGGEED